MITLDQYYKLSGVRETLPFSPYIQMKWQPRAHQITGLNKCLKDPAFGLYDDPGTGKTLILQAVALYHIQQGAKVLAIMPPTLLEQFVESFEDNYIGVGKYVNFHVFDEGPKKRQQLVEEWRQSRPPEVLCISPQMFFKEADTLKELGYDTLICDETHLWLKNTETKTFKIFENYVRSEESRDSHSCYFVLSTGTVQPNEVVDNLAPIHLTNPGVYASVKQFKRRHYIMKKIRMRNPRKIGNKVQTSFMLHEGYKRLEELKKHLYTHGRRVERHQVGEIQEPVVMIDSVTLSSKHQELYKTLLKQRILELPEGEILTATLEQQLRQYALQLISNPQPYAPDEREVRNNLLLRCETLMEGVGIEHVTKVVIFAHYQSTIEYLQDKFSKYNPAVMYGKSDSNENKRKFLHDNTCRLLIANAQSAGVGVDGLQHVSHTAIFYEPTGVPGTFRQAIDRLARSGQESLVNVWVLRAKNTVAKKAIENMRRKADAAHIVSGDRKSLMQYFVPESVA